MPATRLRPALLLALVLVDTGAAYAQSGVRRIAEVTPVLESSGAHAGTVVRAALQIWLPEGVHVNSHQPRDSSVIPLSLTVDAPAGVSVTGTAYPQPSDLLQAGQPVPLSVFERFFSVGVRLALSADTPVGSIRVPVRLRYQACDETRCYLPATATAEWAIQVVAPATPIAVVRGDLFRAMTFDAEARPLVSPAAAPPRAAADASGGFDGFTVAAVDGGFLGVGDFTTFVRRAEGGVSSVAPFAGRGPLAILLVVFAGGLALNLTPCVLPMMPFNLAIIGAGSHGRSRRRGWLLGSVYGGAMAAVYGVLGVVVVLTAQTFGAINASPWFNAGVALVFAALALSMFDVFFIDFSRFSTRVSMPAARGSVALAVTMGAVAALLAGACVAPVVIQVVVFASDLYASGSRAALALPFVLGLGMALPWPFAGAGIAALPKPGVWMVRVKQVFGTAILLTAGYYASTAYTLFAGRVVRPAPMTSSATAMKDGWHTSLYEGLAQARRENKPVLIDLWATWCKACLVMDNTTLADPGVRRALDGYVKVKVQAEDPDRSPARELMARVGAIGLPTYVVLKPEPGGAR
jgi:cytochrome c biogenesis protein CcdA